MGHGVGAFFYIISLDVRHDANATWTIVLDILERLKTLRPDRAHPEESWIQMDNAGSDNKSKCSLTFGKCMVEAGSFKTITFGFLPVGHTHQDIDQLFSVIAQYLKQSEAHSCEQLIAACTAAFTVYPVWSRRLLASEIIDCQAWMGFDTFPDAYLRGIREIYAFHADGSKRMENGQCRWFFKEQMRHAHWIPYEGKSSLVTLNRGTQLFRTLALDWESSKILVAIQWFCQAYGFVLDDDNNLMQTQLPTASIQNRKLAKMYQGVSDLLVTYRDQAKFDRTRCKTCLKYLSRKRKFPTSKRIPEATRAKNKKKLLSTNNKLSLHRADTKIATKCRDIQTIVLSAGSVYKKLVTDPAIEDGKHEVVDLTPLVIVWTASCD